MPGSLPIGQGRQKVTFPTGKSTYLGRFFFSPFNSRSVNCAVSNVAGLKLKITAHKMFKNKFNQIRAGIKFIYFRGRLQRILTANLECVLFSTLQCKRMYFQSTKLANIFYFGATFIHSLAFDRNLTLMPLSVFTIESVARNLVIICFRIPK